jgi:hypothetical protein
MKRKGHGSDIAPHALPGGFSLAFKGSRERSLARIADGIALLKEHFACQDHF